MLDTSYPWCTIGIVEVGTAPNFDGYEHHCTGVLVGRNLMLTASHCIPWDNPNGWLRFIPAYNAGDTPTPFGSSYVTEVLGVKNTDDVDGLDYAICRLQRPLGDQAGWMGTQSFGNNDSYKEGPCTCVGYPDSYASGTKPVVESSIWIDDVDNDGDGKELETRPFTSHGWSGGPLWGWVVDQPKVLGITSGTEDEFSFWDFFTQTNSVFAGGGHMVALVQYGLANWAWPPTSPRGRGEPCPSSRPPRPQGRPVVRRDG